MLSVLLIALKIWDSVFFMAKLRYIHLTLFLLIDLSTTSAWSTTAGTQPTVQSDFDSYLRVIWGLLIVLGIILALYGLLRKRFSLLSSTTQQEIKILEIKPLMGRKALCLVSVRGRDLLLGISGENITHLTSFPGSAEDSFAKVLRNSVEKSQP